MERDGRDEDTGREPGGPDEEPERALRADEEAAWAQIVAGYDVPEAQQDEGRQDDGEAGESAPVRSITVYSAGSGPRDWETPEEDEDDDHFVPPEPPPLPEADTTTKFAWLAALGGPLLLVAAVLFGLDMTWWLLTLGIGGFLGGFATLVARMRDGRDDDEFDDPGRGAVV